MFTMSNDDITANVHSLVVEHNEKCIASGNDDALIAVPTDCAINNAGFMAKFIELSKKFLINYAPEHADDDTIIQSAFGYMDKLSSPITGSRAFHVYRAIVPYLDYHGLRTNAINHISEGWNVGHDNDDGVRDYSENPEADPERYLGASRRSKVWDAQGLTNPHVGRGKPRTAKTLQPTEPKPEVKESTDPAPTLEVQTDDEIPELPNTVIEIAQVIQNVLDARGLGEVVKIEIPVPEPEPVPLSEYERRWTLHGKELGDAFDSIMGNTSRYARLGIMYLREGNTYGHGFQGIGKSHAPQLYAQFYNCPIIRIQPVSMPELLFGYAGADGKLIMTAFLKAIQCECILVFEEGDRLVKEVQDALQPFLADGLVTLMDGTNIQKHEHCLVFMNGNTNMKGNNPWFPHIPASDEAFRDRFSFVEFQYEPHIARAMFGAENEELIEFCEEFSRVARSKNAKLKPLTYRPIGNIVKKIKGDFGLTFKEYLDAEISKGELSEDTLKSIVHDMSISNKWLGQLRRELDDN